jgi:hypothetical protein
MTSDEIISDLTWVSETFPGEALLQAPQHREELTPHLIDALNYICDNSKELLEEKSRYDLHFYALYLLAQFREKQAFAPMIRLLKLDKNAISFFLGDTLTETYDRCLCSVYDGNLGLLKEVIEDSSLYEYARSAALSALELIFREGRILREELCEYLRYLIKHLLDDHDHTHVPSSVACIIADEHLFELVHDVKALYEHKVIDPSAIGYYDSFINDIFSYRKYNEEKKTTIDDVIQELGHWAKYKQKAKSPQKLKKLKSAKNTVPTAASAAKKNKIGRNDPCPCGSGKKYKKCCLLTPTPAKKPPSDVYREYEEDKKLEYDDDYDDYDDFDDFDDYEAEGENEVDYLKALAKISKTLFPHNHYEDSKPYDLLTDYPPLDAEDAKRQNEELAKDKKYVFDPHWTPTNQRYLTEFYNEKALKIDIPVYKALYHRAIPIWVKRSKRREDIEKISLLREAFELFKQTCAEEGITKLSEFDAKYMVHYKSEFWIGRLNRLLNYYEDSLSASDIELKNEAAGVMGWMK